MIRAVRETCPEPVEGSVSTMGFHHPVNSRRRWYMSEMPIASRRRKADASNANRPSPPAVWLGLVSPLRYNCYVLTIPYSSFTIPH
jgi:hypothetical protein